MFSAFLHPYFVSIFGLKMVSWRPIFTVVINRNQLLRYNLCAISKYNIYEKQIHESFGKFKYEFDILKFVVVNL